ncbi:MAG TPA: hypothetical protein VF469_06170 [Kofleriaceae bacterium]
MSESGTGELEERIARLEQQDERLTRALELLAGREAAPAVKAGRDWDAYAAVIASFIGLLALAISGYTAYVQRQQLRAQVWPHLQLWKSTVNLGFYVTNQGTGPACVTAVRVTVDGAPVKTWEDARNVAGFSERWIKSTLSKRVLPPGKDFTILQPMEDEQSLAKFRELLLDEKHAVSITVCYCSVLDECWVASFGTVPESDQVRSPVACPIGATERFAD